MIEATGLQKRFGTTQALDGVDLAARQGTVLGVLGPNGAGKTTAVRVLATLLRPDAGSARIGGYDVLRDPQQVRNTIGLTGQYASVDEDLTGTQNLVMIAQLLNLSTRQAKVASDRAAGVVRPDRRRRPDGQELLRRDAPSARSGREPGRPAGRHLPGRADHRSGPGEARGHVGRHPQSRRRGLDRAADHPVPRRGRCPRRRDQRDRPRPGHRSRHPRGPQEDRRRSTGRGPPHGSEAAGRGGEHPGRDRLRCSRAVRPQPAVGAGAGRGVPAPGHPATDRGEHRRHRAVPPPAEPGRGVPHPDGSAGRRRRAGRRPSAAPEGKAA